MFTSLNHSFFKQLLHQILMLSFAVCAISASAKDLAPDQKSLLNESNVSIQEAWVRPTRAGQDVGAAYMTLTSQKDTTLVHIDSDVTKTVEIHSMTMKNGVMKMRMLDTLQLPAGKPYKLEPGGFHLMLFDLKKPLIEGEQVSFEFTFRNGDTAEFKQKIKCMVKTAGDEAENSSHKNHHHR